MPSLCSGWADFPESGQCPVLTLVFFVCPKGEGSVPTGDTKQLLILEPRALLCLLRFYPMGAFPVSRDSPARPPGLPG